MKLILESWREYLNEKRAKNLVYRGISRSDAEEAQITGHPPPSHAINQAINDQVVLKSHFGEDWRYWDEVERDEEIEKKFGITPYEKFPLGINTSRKSENAAGYAGKYEDDGGVMTLDISGLGDEDYIEFNDGTVFVKDVSDDRIKFKYPWGER